MFSLESAYAFFMRTVLAKSCEDYDFPDVNLTEFIETEIGQASQRGDIALPAWVKIIHDLITSMRQKLVSSVFEEDIFYWWSEAFEEKDYMDLFHIDKLEESEVLLGEAVAKTVLILAKFDFSEIEGDPLGILYQRYFDKETRKALGEFYTPQEVVDYILNSTDYQGSKVLQKRLLDPACGSGTFLVTALKRYLENSKEEASRKGWDWVLENLCNKYRIVGFDIHPFATIMAQIQFMLVLIPYYKKALETEPSFVLQRVPIFRTDSLEDESKIGEEEEEKFPLISSQDKITMPVRLPVQNSKEGFFKENFTMPRSEAVIESTDLLSNEEYFSALQGLFDVVKQQMKEPRDKSSVPDFNKDLFKKVLMEHYLTDKNWTQLTNYFEPFAKQLLEKIHILQSEFDDGRLVKSIEDIFFAALLKNEQKYDFVVGNPPYVEIQGLDKKLKDKLESYYKSTDGGYDIYVPFIERGIEWLAERGKLGYINSNRYAKVNYGKKLRRYLLNNASIDQYIDLKDSNVFKDAVNYPVINIFSEGNPVTNSEPLKVARLYSNFDFQKVEINVLKEINNSLKKLGDNHLEREFFDSFTFNQEELDTNGWFFMPPSEKRLFEKIRDVSSKTLMDVSLSNKKNSALFEGSSTGLKPVFVVKKKADLGDKYQIESPQSSQMYTLEKGIMKEYADDVGRWFPESNEELAIFPYQDGEVIEESKFESEYTQAYKYLKEFKEKLQSRRSLSKNQKWYEYSAARSLEKYPKEKLMINGFSQKSSVSFDEEGEYVFGPDVYGLELKKEYKEMNKLILAILNSKITDFFIKQVGVVHQGASYKFEDRFIKNLPIKLGTIPELEELILKIRKLKRLKNKINSFPSDYLPPSEELNMITLKSRAGHKEVTPQIQKTLDDTFHVIIGKRKKEDPIEVNSSGKAKFIQQSLTGRDVEKGEDLEMLIPRSMRAINKALKEYNNDKEKIKNSKDIVDLEDEINKKVFTLYNLSGMMENVDHFLNKFSMNH